MQPNFNNLGAKPGNFKIDKNKLTLAENDTIIAAAKAYIEADVSISPGSLTYTFDKTQQQFARVKVGSNEGGGFYAILKKSYGLWVVVCTGQDLPSKAIGQKFGLPEGWYAKDY